ncbi:LysE family translocator [Pendulispora albinea]|uniref:LysE family transporter n=1 Tax=Pendulispora albinea TaxID=2741071 RepID=A0ABZ2LW31_9BACT
MNYVSLLLTLLAVDLLAVVSPGPNFIVVMETAMLRGGRRAAAVVLGIVAGNFVWCVAVALGLSALFVLVPWLYGAMKIFGGAYLIYLGISAWRKKGEGVDGNTARPSAAGGSSQTAAASRGSLVSGFLRGALTTLTNPKTIVYFGSIFALFLKPDMPIWVKGSSIGIVIVNGLLWYGAVALLFSHHRVQRIYGRAERWIARVTGAVMIGFGARLMLTRE